jgi:hypothetical protein
MESTYYNLLAPASYGGLSKFKPKGDTKKQVKEWLQSQDSTLCINQLDDDFPGDAFLRVLGSTV